MSNSLLNHVRKNFSELFGNPQISLTSGGRANIIGEHTDYYGGFVLPFAIDKGITFAASKSLDQNQIISLDFKATFRTAAEITKGDWKSYVASCINEIQSQYEVDYISMVFGGNIPIGAGLSSSSALVCGIIEVYNQLYQLNISEVDKVNLASKIEHGAGVKGGKMDQYSIFFGKDKHALLLDCKSLSHESIPLDFSWNFLLINSGVKHNLAQTEYNTRRKEGEGALNKVKRIFPEILSVRDLDFTILEECKKELSETEYHRILHVLLENERVLQFCEYMEADDLINCGRLLNLSHDSLQNLYEVSCDQLNTLQHLANQTSFIYGSRMMGGGFGGCTINLFENLNEDELDYLLESYSDRFKIVPEYYIVRPHKGITIHE